MRVIGIRRVNFGDLCIVGKFLMYKKKVESLRDSNNKHVSNINDKIHVLKEHY